MAYWFTTQDPQVLESDDDKYGIWESKRGRDSGNKLRRGDKVAIYEVQKSKNGRNDGAKAIVAIVQVTRRIRPAEGPDEYGFWKIAEARLIAKDEKGLSGEKVKTILDGNNTPGNFGLLVLQYYGGRVIEMPYEKFARVEKYFSDDANRSRARKAEGEEGREETAERKFRTRCSGLVAEKKRLSDYRCQVCGMAFQETYGERGREYIIVHHSDPYQ